LAIWFQRQPPNEPERQRSFRLRPDQATGEPLLFKGDDFTASEQISGETVQAFPDRDFEEEPPRSSTTHEIAANVRLDLDAQSRPVGLDIDHASKILDLGTLESEDLPLQPTPARRRAVG
jgi:hypothetical protein